MMLARSSRLKLLAETARQRALQERALHLGDASMMADTEFEIGWDTIVADDVLRDPRRGDHDGPTAEHRTERPRRAK